MSGWQLISTAPKGRRHIWLGCKSFLRVGMWLDGRWADAALAYARLPADLQWEPTHWQPIPSPPADDPNTVIERKLRDFGPIYGYSAEELVDALNGAGFVIVPKGLGCWSRKPPNINGLDAAGDVAREMTS